MPDTDRIIVSSAIAILGALAIGIKLAEGINALLKRKGEPILMDTQTNGGVVSGSANSTSKVTWR